MYTLRSLTLYASYLDIPTIRLVFPNESCTLIPFTCHFTQYEAYPDSLLSSSRYWVVYPFLSIYCTTCNLLRFSSMILVTNGRCTPPLLLLPFVRVDHGIILFFSYHGYFIGCIMYFYLPHFEFAFITCFFSVPNTLWRKFSTSSIPSYIFPIFLPLCLYHFYKLYSFDMSFAIVPVVFMKISTPLSAFDIISLLSKLSWYNDLMTEISMLKDC